jgi:hypothetical protein
MVAGRDALTYRPKEVRQETWNLGNISPLLKLFSSPLDFCLFTNRANTRSTTAEKPIQTLLDTSDYKQASCTFNFGSLIARLKLG